jgi:hypothetical protein
LLIGIISDSHDNLPKIDAAVSRRNVLNVGLVLHAADYCAPFATLRYRGLRVKMIGVLGNNDAESDLLKANFESLGHELNGRFTTVEVDGFKIALLHGDETKLLDEIIKSQTYDLVVSGHTHSISRSPTGRTVWLKPGEMCGYLTGKATITTYEIISRTIEILNI